MSNRPGTPLPDELSGVEQLRVIRLDSSLFYLVTGALSYLVDKEPLEQVGTLTVGETRAALSAMLWSYLTESVSMPFIGEYKMMAWTITEPGWLVCHGQTVNRADYPLLFDLIGTSYNTGGESGTVFRLPDFQTRSPVGAVSGASQPVGHYGAETQQLGLTHMPPHHHQQTVNNTTPQVRFTAGGSTINTATGATSSSSTPLTTQDTGGSAGAAVPFDLYHPVQEIRMYIFAGLP